jgi:hypothetical protein
MCRSSVPTSQSRKSPLRRSGRRSPRPRVRTVLRKVVWGILHAIACIGLLGLAVFEDNGGPSNPVFAYTACGLMLTPWLYLAAKAIYNRIVNPPKHHARGLPPVLWDTRTCQHCTTGQAHGGRMCIRCGRVLATGASGQATS